MKDYFGGIALTMKEFIAYIATSLIMFFTPVGGILIAVAVAIALDTIFGISKAITKKEKLTSRRASHIVSKFVLYQAAVLLIFTMDKFLLGEFFKIWFSIEFFFTKVVAIIIIFIEMLSMKENFEEAFNINIFSKVKEALKRTKEFKEDIQEITK
jgi:hypothetical protein